MTSPLKLLRNIGNNHLLFWLVLALPSIILTKRLIDGQDPEWLLHPTGEFSARLLIIALMLTPALRVSHLIGGFGSNIVRWFIARRRAIGVASFCYALAHTILYVVDLASISKLLEEFTEHAIWTGWLAIFIFIPLAITSNDYSVRRLRLRWKPLQRLVYIAAIATLLHWMFIHGNYKGALIQFFPLAFLQAIRVVDYLFAKNTRFRRKTEVQD